MIEVRGFDENHTITLPEIGAVDSMTSALDILTNALTKEAVKTGGIITTDWDDNTVSWDGGPTQWADAYAVGCGATNRVFTCYAGQDGVTLHLDKLH